MNAPELVLSGNLLIGIPLALAAGLLSFLSPCVLPLVPGYLGYLGSLADHADPEAPGRVAVNRRRLTAAVALFVLGFTAVFVAYNAAFGALGWWLIRWQDLIIRIAGVLVLAMGLVFIGRIAWLQRVAKPQVESRGGLWGAPVLGIAFGIGWTPCTGPVLAAITILSLDSGSAWVGVLLGVMYSLGLGIPFLLVAFGIGWASDALRWVRTHIRTINLIGGGMLVLLGILMVSGLWSGFMSWLQGVMPGYVTAI